MVVCLFLALAFQGADIHVATVDEADPISVLEVMNSLDKFRVNWRALDYLSAHDIYVAKQDAARATKIVRSIARTQRFAVGLAPTFVVPDLTLPYHVIHFRDPNWNATAGHMPTYYSKVMQSPDFKDFAARNPQPVIGAYLARRYQGIHGKVVGYRVVVIGKTAKPFPNEEMYYFFIIEGGEVEGHPQASNPRHIKDSLYPWRS